MSICIHIKSYNHTIYRTIYYSTLFTYYILSTALSCYLLSFKNMIIWFPYNYEKERAEHIETSKHVDTVAHRGTHIVTHRKRPMQTERHRNRNWGRERDQEREQYRNPECGTGIRKMFAARSGEAKGVNMFELHVQVLSLFNHHDTP